MFLLAYLPEKSLLLCHFLLLQPSEKSYWNANKKTNFEKINSLLASLPTFTIFLERVRLPAISLGNQRAFVIKSRETMIKAGKKSFQNLPVRSLQAPGLIEIAHRPPLPNK